MPHWGLYYLAFCALVCVVGWPIVALMQKFGGGPSEERDGCVWTIIATVLLFGALALASRYE